MIISASRRTDIPAYHSQWLINRFLEGYALVPNPMNPRSISRIELSPDVVDGIVFWTKNPLPMLDQLHHFSAYPYYFQYTLTAYGKDVEPHVPSKNDVIIPTFQKLASIIGRERIVWRYDPIFLSPKYTFEYHCTYFRKLAEKLQGSTEKCIVSFLDFYQDTARNMSAINPVALPNDMRTGLLARLSSIAAEYGLSIDTCAEDADYSHLGIGRASCIDKARLERIGGWKLSLKKDANQRGACGCMESVDIGSYGTCPAGCRYCYAQGRAGLSGKSANPYDPSAPLLCGSIRDDAIIKTRVMKSLKEGQLSLLADEDK